MPSHSSMCINLLHVTPAPSSNRLCSTWAESCHDTLTHRKLLKCAGSTVSQQIFFGTPCRKCVAMAEYCDKKIHQDNTNQKTHENDDPWKDIMVLCCISLSLPEAAISVGHQTETACAQELGKVKFTQHSEMVHPKKTLYESLFVNGKSKVQAGCGKKVNEQNADERPHAAQSCINWKDMQTNSPYQPELIQEFHPFVIHHITESRAESV
mmetsp:Transcript_30147/g.59147  ORF Transcript_30147/g.59147 Transcript_30147/m.59147 type:complete len:210 (-) Transcript_30147:397-1026(-)